MKLEKGNKMAIIESIPYSSNFGVKFYEDGFRALITGTSNSFKSYKTEKGAIAAAKRFLNK